MGWRFSSRCLYLKTLRLALYNQNSPKQKHKLYMICNFLKTLCTLSAKDRGATKVDLELILMHHFSRILRLDITSVLSRSTEYSTQLFSSRPYFTHLNNHSKYGRPKVLKSVIYAPRSLPTVCIVSANSQAKSGRKADKR